LDCAGTFGQSVSCFQLASFIFLHGSTVLLDILAIEAAWLAANLIYFGLSTEQPSLSGLWQGGLLFPAVTVLSMAVVGVYRRHPRYFTDSDIPQMIIIITLAWTAVSLLLLEVFQRNTLLALAPISLLMVLPIISMVKVWRREAWLRFIKSSHIGRKKKIVIYGAGLRAVTMASFIDLGFPGSRLMGIIDDRDEMRGRYFF
jgi:Predicted nucleoside-diphosphate sugar epimerases